MYRTDSTISTVNNGVFDWIDSYDDVRGFPHKNLMLYNDQTLATTIKHTATTPNLKFEKDNDRNNIEFYVLTDNRSVAFLVISTN